MAAQHLGMSGKPSARFRTKYFVQAAPFSFADLTTLPRLSVSLLVYMGSQQKDRPCLC